MTTTALIKQIPIEIENSITDFAESTTPQRLKRVHDIRRDKIFAVKSFFSLVHKQLDQVTVSDINLWHQWMLDHGKTKKQKQSDGSLTTIQSGLEESTIYTRLSHLSAYFEWLRKLPEFSHFIKVNPVRLAMPKPPKKYNSRKAKSLTDEDFSKLWLYLENLAIDKTNLIAIRDYAIFRLFCATGMRREEVLGLTAGDIKFTSEGLLLHALVKGGDYEWRTITDEEVIAALERYLTLAKRKSTISDQSRALWIRFDRGAKLAQLAPKQNPHNDVEPGLSSHSFDKQIKKYAHEAGIGHFHIHQLRHTFARIVAEDSGSLIETQDALGHANLETTRVYVKQIQFKKDKHSRQIRQRIQALETQTDEVGIIG